MKIMRGWNTNLLISRRAGDKNIFTLFLFILGMALPFLLVTYVHYYCTGDVATFRSWAECLEKYSQKIYLACKPVPPNYPTVGLLMSAGIIHVIKSIFGVTNGKIIDDIFRHYLAFFDLINFLLLIWLASLMKFRFPIFIGLILLIVPSTLVGGALWGQIDGISLCFCLLATIGFFKSWLSKVDSGNRNGWKSGLWLLFGVINLSIYILTKQLSIFSLPFFLLLWFIVGWKLWKDFHYRGLFWLVTALSVFTISLHFLDSVLAVPAQFNNSSFWYVWMGGGSEHAEQISGNGFNIWMFLGRKMLSSSHAPFPLLWNHGLKLDASPYKAGIFLYGIFLAFLLLTGLRMSWLFIKSKTDTEQQNNRNIYPIACLCFFLGLSYLGFNVLLTGTHERYLYLGYPFLLISIIWFYVNKLKFSWRSTIFCFFAASAYGFFVFAWMDAPLPGIFFPLRRHEFLASIHFFLLAVLIEKWVQIWLYSEASRAKQQIKSPEQQIHLGI
jgi:hypothetical protein